jgi:hypothetical protein
VDQILKTAPKGSGYLEVWGVRHYMKQAQYASALALLDGLLPRRELSDFNMIERVKALFSGYQEAEAQVAFDQAVAALPDEETHDLSAWMCARQLQNGCEAVSGIACRTLARDTQGPISFDDSTETLARVLSKECKTAGQVDYLKLSDAATDSPEWKWFFMANLKRQREDRSAAASLFAKVIEDAQAPDALRVEATRRLAQFATPKQMENVVGLWARFDSKEAWVRAGNLLFNRLVEQRNSRLALKVAHHLMNWQSLSPKGMTLLASLTDSSINRRMPASVTGREPVKQLLNGLEEGN